MITSHETQDDFEVFYDGLINEAESLDIDFDPEFIMQDACPASKNAVLEFFPNSKFLMCYFHVKKNVREHKNLLVDKERYKDMVKDLTTIHMSTSEAECKKNKLSFSKKYSKKEPSMYDYCTSWFNGEWSNWMIFCSKPGLANTNSNIESFNNVLKRDYFERRKVPMRTAISKIFECIVFYSTEFSEFKTRPEVKQKTLKLALGYTKANFKSAISNKNLIEYNGIMGSKYKLTFNNTKIYQLGFGCTCSFFVKSAICSHLVAYDMIAGLKLFNIRAKPETFVTKNKKGRKSNAIKNKIGKALEKD